MELYNQEDIRKINEEEKMKEREREREREREKSLYISMLNS